MGEALSITDFLIRLCNKIALWFSCFVGDTLSNIKYLVIFKNLSNFFFNGF
jgi:hypothetical protein